jgi:hypothetical protein
MTGQADRLLEMLGLDRRQLSDRDAQLVADLILKAFDLPRGEAFNIGGDDGIIIARSSSGKLWVGHGGLNCNWVRWWRKGNAHETLAEACRAHLDWTQSGYLATRFRDACCWTLDHPSHKVTGIGRQEVRLA